MSKLYQSEMPIFFTPPPTKMDKRMWKDSPSPPPPDPKMYEVMDKQIGLSQQTLDFVKGAYSENKVRQAGLDKMNMDVGNSLLTDAATNRERSADAYDFYKKSGQPVQQKMYDEAKNYDSAENIGAFRGRAAADVNSAYGNIEGEQARTLSRFGVMPNASRLASINAGLLASKAAASAGAQNNAELGVRNQAISMRQSASNLAAGLPSQTLAFSQAAQGNGQAAVGNGITTNGANLQSQGQATSGYGAAGNGLSGASNTGSNIANTQMQGYNAQQQANASSSAGFGQLAGLGASLFLADGGVVGQPAAIVRGPGTGVSDSVPAVNTSTGQPVRLSNGEMVLPADVVRHYGTAHFQKLIDKAHTPAAIQRKQGAMQ